PLERLGTFLSDERVRVVTLGKEEKTNLPPFLGFRQRILQRAPCGGPAGTVAVEGEYHLTHGLENAPQVIGRRRRPERGHGVLNSVLVQPHDVEIPLHDEQALERRAVLAHLVRSVELL